MVIPVAATLYMHALVRETCKCDCMHTAKIKWLVLTHIRLPHAVAAPVPENVHAVTCSAVKSLYSGSQARSALFGEDRNGLVQNMCYYGSFLPLKFEKYGISIVNWHAYEMFTGEQVVAILLNLGKLTKS